MIVRAGLTLFVAGALLAATHTPVSAQVRRPPARQELERQIQQRFQQRVRQELGLSVDEARELAGMVEGFQEQRRELVRREMALRMTLRGTGALLSDAAALEALEEMAAVQEEEARLLRAEQERLLDTLSAPQVLRFYTLRAELAERIRRIQRGGAGPPGVRFQER